MTLAGAGCWSCTATATGSPARSGSAIVAEDLRRTAEVEYVLVPGGTHAMLSHRRAFDGAAAGFWLPDVLADPV